MEIINIVAEYEKSIKRYENFRDQSQQAIIREKEKINFYDAKIDQLLKMIKEHKKEL